MRLLVCGDRNWSSKHAIARVISELQPSVVIHGAAAGADAIADDVAAELQIERLPFPASWKTLGRAAGPARNRKMIEAKPDLVAAFHPDLSQSRGTRDLVKQAKRAGIPVRLYSGSDGVEFTSP